MDNKEINIIYGLYDPQELGGELRYIGQSAQGIKRAWHHKKPYGLKVKNHKTNWINSLINQQLMYDVKILVDLGSFSSSQERDSALNLEEIRLISELKTDKLTNSTAGGEGTRGNVLSSETKNILSQKRKEWHKMNDLPGGFKKYTQPKLHQINDAGLEIKHCSDCKEWNLLENYTKESKNSDGLRSICKNCVKIRFAKKQNSVLTQEEWEQSYVDRKGAMSAGVKAKYAADPEYRKKNSKAKSKAIIGTSVADSSKTIEFPSALVAYSEAGFNNTYISSSIKTGKPYKGYFWSFK